MEEYEVRSKQVIKLLEGLSENRAKKVLIAFCHDVINAEMSRLQPSSSSKAVSSNNNAAVAVEPTTPFLIDLCSAHVQRSLLTGMCFQAPWTPIS
ncbi:hypothetical protein SAMD00019534_013190 [Acytostelium subglobosum LB1]|uniref:hypothetical protein n=1 Tax=Acytostelium subglobosum LB1 TaxID=1410327 RepID=UPI0006451771|nr:hypothetical protein SAMD00019534_013190 [Acytostelium subglobosum LB1]GAM18144.1 hypothetical protein SAMD00019534_013190 [Acytostelium subglobosum LB1]|eukprot:XP_012758740.1 hypothetical protein SAMD00019534_013190 [Acytostelium subglobosum LB1]